MNHDYDAILTELQMLKCRIEAMKNENTAVVQSYDQHGTNKEDLVKLAKSVPINIERILFPTTTPTTAVGLFIYLSEKHITTSGKHPVDDGFMWTFSKVDTPETYSNIDDAFVANFLSPFSNDQRVRILKNLLYGPKTAKELMDELALTTGQLYHHLRELAKSGYLKQSQRNVYELRGNVRKLAIVILSCIGSQSMPAGYEIDVPECEG